MIAEARNIADWTGLPLAQHWDADVYRFAIAQRVARELLREWATKASKLPRWVRRGRIETISVGAQDGRQAWQMIATPRSKVRG